MTIEGPLSALIDELNRKLRAEDLSALLDASKDDGIDEEELSKLSSPNQWLLWLCEKLLLTNDDLSFIEHVFELCRRPDLLTIVLEYRIKNLSSSEDQLPARQCVRVPSAKKYQAAKLKQPDVQMKPGVQLAAPPKARRQSTAT
ncbi:astrocytic phosphoprotein PEA-15-like [Clavelina lepadiformis]|uniref:astrocytic phosphoprotein PEA-15-like n=1 Tax=Clavelina lepadiformis TaxID=159417 RepID=UPI004041D2AA